MKPKTGKDLSKKLKSNDKVKNESDNELELVLGYDSSDEMVKEVEKVIRKNKPKVEKTDEDKGVVKQEVVKKAVTGEAFIKLEEKSEKTWSYIIRLFQ